MWLETSYLIVSGTLIFFNQLNFGISKPMIGPNVMTAKKGEFPSLVSISFIDDESLEEAEHNHLCSGALITCEHVLTVEHCLKDRSQNETQVILGSRNLRYGIEIEISWWITYNEWIDHKDMLQQFRMNDVAVIKLAQNASKNIETSVLSSMTPQQLYRRKVTVVAWGETEKGKTSKVLHQVTLTVLTKKECEDKIYRINGRLLRVPDRYLCTIAEPYAVMQNGDSGGPVFFKNKIVGIHKSTCPKSNRPYDPTVINVHIGIDYYRNFIDDVTSPDFEWS